WCQFPILPGSTYSLKSDGTGTIALKLGTPTEADGDFDCSAIFGTAAVTLSIAFVTTGSGAQFFFTSNDDYNSAASSDSGGDFVPFSGQCTRQ
ncbi:MAG TPA: hypothetical protein VJN94_12440, partial [Candidatus Binataceae bacterium]|nr:hypothetical protein [Candidatus Binataceae bacterium]